MDIIDLLDRRRIWREPARDSSADGRRRSASTPMAERGCISEISLVELNHWISTVPPGETLAYHRGCLAMDRGPGSRLGEEAGLELDRVATTLMELADAGDVHLVQRRHGPNDYTYVAVRARSRRRSVRPAHGGRS